MDANPDPCNLDGFPSRSMGSRWIPIKIQGTLMDFHPDLWNIDRFPPRIVIRIAVPNCIAGNLDPNGGAVRARAPRRATTAFAVALNGPFS